MKTTTVVEQGCQTIRNFFLSGTEVKSLSVIQRVRFTATGQTHEDNFESGEKLKKL